MGSYTSQDLRVTPEQAAIILHDVLGGKYTDLKPLSDVEDARVSESRREFVKIFDGRTICGNFVYDFSGKLKGGASYFELLQFVENFAVKVYNLGLAKSYEVKFE